MSINWKKIGKGVAFIAIFGVTGLVALGSYKLYLKFKNQNLGVD